MSPLTLQPTVQILSRFLQEQILVRRKSQELFQNLRSSWKKLLATLKVSGALFAASYRNLRTSYENFDNPESLRTYFLKL